MMKSCHFFFLVHLQFQIGNEDNKELITNNEEDGTNYYCQGIRGAAIIFCHVTSF